MRTHDQNVVAQFDPKAQAYLTSSVHAAGPDLDRTRELALHLPVRRSMLDVGCGAGHLGFALAPLFNQVVATDLSPSMLATVRRTAVQKGLPQIEVKQASAESLPFPDGSFDLVCSRYSAHHWHDVTAALREMRRVARPGGALLMIDLMGDESPLVDTHLQSIELLRDPSHVRDYSPAQWRDLLKEAGIKLEHEAFWATRMDFDSWVERMRTPDASVAAIRGLLAGAAHEVRESLAVESDGSFVPRTGLFWGNVLMA
jgi:ubiquinone/menaquinone biosynthesis C-methylase UbiE